MTHAVPGIHPYFYIGSEALNHTTEYTAASGKTEEQSETLSVYFHYCMTESGGGFNIYIMMMSLIQLVSLVIQMLIFLLVSLGS